MIERFISRGRRTRTFARSLAACLLPAALVAAPASAYYEEAHVVGDDVKITVDTAGSAKVEHDLSWHVFAGQLHGLDLPGIDTPLDPEPEATVTSEDGRVVEAAIGRRDDHTLRIAFADPKGVRHGHYKIRLGYRVDLVETHGMVRDGAMWRLTWRGLSWPDGYDSARVMFELPPAIDAPQCAAGDDGAEGGTLCTLRRALDRDEVELVKPHVARREAIAWSVRVAPRAFPGIHDPTLRPPSLPSIEPQRRGLPPLVFFAGLLAVALTYACLARRKAIQFDEACRAYGARARGLVPGPLWLRATFAGIGMAAGVLAEAVRAPTCGGACIAFAMIMACLRPPRVRLPVRGPGRWLALRPSEAFEGGVSNDWFDPLRFRGALAAVAALSSLAALGFSLRTYSSAAPYFTALAALAGLPMVATGRRSQLPPDGRSGARWLRRLFVVLSKDRMLRVTPWARVPVGRLDPDELRVLAVPRAGVPGLVGIEVGLAWPRGPTSYVPAPAVIVRVHDASAASARMASLAPFARSVPGRKPDERAYGLVPRFPTRAGTLALVRRLGRELVDRRGLAQSWKQAERRLLPDAREKAVPNAA